MKLGLTKSELEIIVDCWRASNRYEQIKMYKTEQRLKEELILIGKVLCAYRGEEETKL
jgi:hypothetical protein